MPTNKHLDNIWEVYQYNSLKSLRKHKKIKYMQKGEIYQHCVFCKAIFVGDWEEKILTGIEKLSHGLVDYFNITSTACPKCNEIEQLKGEYAY